MLSLSSTQRPIWFDQLLHGSSALYNLGGCLGIRGQVDAELFCKALNVVLAANDVFSYVFKEENGIPVQCKEPFKAYQPELMDYSAMEDPHEACIQWMKAEAERPFAWKDCETYRFALLKASDDYYYWYVKLHHLIADGWAISLLVKQVGKIYEQLMFGEEPRPESFPYKDFVDEDTLYLSSESYAKDLQFWKEKFSSLPEALDIKGQNGINRKEARSQRRSIFIRREEYNRLLQYANQEGATIFHLFTGLLYSYFQKISGKTDMVFGLPVLNRGKAAYKRTIGLFAGMMPLRIATDATISFSELLRLVKSEVRNCFKFQRVAVDEIVNLFRSMQAGNPDLFEVSLSFEKHDYNQPFAGMETDNVVLPHNHESLALAVFVREYKDHEDVQVDLDFNLGCWNEAYIDLFVSRFKGLFQQLLDNPQLDVSDFNLISEEDQAVLRTFNDTSRAFPDKTFVEIFEEKASRFPERNVLFFENRHYTFAEVRAEVNRLAAILQHQGVAQGDIVAIAMERSPEMIISILAALKAGAAYLPIDPYYPAERITFIIQDAKAKLLLLNDDMILSKCGSSCICLNLRDLPQEVPAFVTVHYRATDTAYIIYTSGSTGIPKGVEIRHFNILNTLHALQHDYPFAANDVYLFKTTFCFDVSVAEIFSWIIGEGCLAILPAGKEKHIPELLQFVEENAVTHLNLVPSVFALMVSLLKEKGRKLPSSLKYIFVAGEAITKESISNYKLVAGKERLENLYGPTEASIYASGFSLNGYDLKHSNVPIGRPFSNTELFVMEKGKPLPVGVAGELYIVGKGVAKGYINRPELSREMFIENQGRIMYRSGDLVRLLPDANIEFLGRKDRQVKIRGYRIETGEIENCILKSQLVKQAVVLALPINGELQLVCYLSGSKELEPELRRHIAGFLPEFMVPAVFVFMESLPVNENGKIDHKRLQQMEFSIKGADNYTAPRSEIETKLSHLWSSVLGVKHVGVQDNFFQLGGHSLKATQLIAAIENTLQHTLSLKEFFDHPTIQSQAMLLEGKEKHSSSVIEKLDLADSYALSSAQHQLLLAWMLNKNSVAYNLFGVFELKTAPDEDLFDKAIHLVCNKHESLRTTFTSAKGTYRQIIHEKPLTKTEYLDFYSLEEQNEYISKEAKLPFDLETGPLFLVKLLKAPGRNVLIMKLHHIISDGWSNEILLAEISRFYAAAGRTEMLPDAIQFKEYAAWQNHYLEGKAGQDAVEFWQKIFSSIAEPLSFPYDFSRPVIKTYNGAQVSITLQKELTEKFKILCAKLELSLYQGLMAFYKILLYKYTGQKDITVGTALAGRDRSEILATVGNFVNTIPLRGDVEGSESFEELAPAIRKQILLAFAYAFYPLDKIITAVNAPVQRDRSPLFDFGFTWQNTRTEGWKQFAEVFDAALLPEANAHFSAKYDLWLLGTEDKECINIDFEYNTDILKAESVKLFAQRFINLMESITNDPSQLIDKIAIDSDAQESITDTASFEFEF